jgi:hypothetical protein
MNFYLNRFGFQGATFHEKPHPNLEIVVVIPCFNEPDLLRSLQALFFADKPSCAVEIITVINSGEQHDAEIKSHNLNTFIEAKEWADKVNTERFNFRFILEADLPKKHAGVGLARKIGMDEAVARFDKLNKDGIIVCFDADSSCAKNYLTEIYTQFKKFPKAPGAAIYFEHPIEGKEFEPTIYQGIIQYELHLRYYNQALVYCGLPYAFHTVGSSMAVRSSVYQQQGGMNKRKAGEDFYFIHKIIALGEFMEIRKTKVIPSPRVSDRVPFGTGKAIGDWMESGGEMLTYQFKIFQLIKVFVGQIKHLYTHDFEELDIHLSQAEKSCFTQFLTEQKFEERLKEIRKNAKDIASFTKRFYRWFDAFKVLKLVHFLRDHGYENQPIQQEVDQLLQTVFDEPNITEVYHQLIFLREIEKK